MVFDAIPWWSWSLILFVFTSLLGVVAVIAGVGGGVLFVPIVSALFPFHLDFVRGAGLMVALTGALSASPHLLRSGLANLRLALPFALIGSASSIAGAVVGLALPESTVKILLGSMIFGIVVVMIASSTKKAADPEESDALARKLGIQGEYVDAVTDRLVRWSIKRTPIGLVLFIGIGFVAGMFGLGAGWASVPALHLLLSAPLKIAVATSGLILSMNSAGAWVYLHRGAVLPIIAVPSVLGMMIGTRIGARLLTRVRPRLVKLAVVGILLLTAIRQLLDGLGVMP